MYSYDRTITARRSVGEDIQEVQNAVKAAEESLPLIKSLLQGYTDILSFLEVPRPESVLDEAEFYLKAATRIVKELPGVLKEIDHLDDAIDSYARHLRKNLAKNREKLTVKDLDRSFLREIKLKALPLLRQCRSIKNDADEAPASLGLEDFYGSKKIERLNELAERLNDLSSEMAFDSSSLESFLEIPENLLLERLNV